MRWCSFPILSVHNELNEPPAPVPYFYSPDLLELSGGERVVGGVEVIEQKQTVHPLDVHPQVASFVEESGSPQLAAREFHAGRRGVSFSQVQLRCAFEFGFRVGFRPLGP